MRCLGVQCTVVVLCMIAIEVNGKKVEPGVNKTGENEKHAPCKQPKCIANASYNDKTNKCECKKDLPKPPAGLTRITQSGFDCHVPCSQKEMRVECDNTGHERCEMQHNGTEWFPVCECMGPSFKRNKATGRCEPINVCVSCEYELCPATHECAYTFQPGSSGCVINLAKHTVSTINHPDATGVFSDKENRPNACVNEPKPPCHEFATRIDDFDKQSQLTYSCHCNQGYEGNGFHCRLKCNDTPYVKDDGSAAADKQNKRADIESKQANGACAEDHGIPVQWAVCYKEKNKATGKLEKKCGCAQKTTEVMVNGTLTCQNVNECDLCEVKCRRNSICHDSIMGYEDCPGNKCLGYSCECAAGFKRNTCADNSNCIDDNQCADGKICEQFSRHMECKDSNYDSELSWYPWYRCQCKKGWRGDWVDNEPFTGKNETYCIASCNPFKPLTIPIAKGKKETVEAVYTGNNNNRINIRAGTKAEFRCPPGYLPRYPTAECKTGAEGGEWTHPYECIRACPSLTVDHAKTNCQDHQTMDKGSCAVTCDTTYVLENGNCTCNGHTWSCKPRCVQSCALITAEKGSVRYNPPVHVAIDKPIQGTVATITCDSNHHYDCGMNSMSLSCEEGQWSPGQNRDFFANNKITCHPPCASLNIKNAVAAVNDLKPYCNKTEIKCNSGYYLTTLKQRIDQASAECRAFGMWNQFPSKDIQCTLGCRDNFVVKNGKMVYIDVKDNLVADGSTVTTVCHDGYVLTDVGTGTCSKGKFFWTSGRSPQCVKYCENHLKVPNGEIKSNSKNTFTTFLVSGALVYYAKSSVELKCEEGYTVIGSNSTKCGEDGKWSTKLGTCKKICLNKELIISHGHGDNLESDYSFVGEKKNITCKKGYSKNEVTEKIFAICEITGWTFICDDKTCLMQICFPYVQNDGTRKGIPIGKEYKSERVLINGVHTWTCDPGYKATADVTHHQVVDVNTYEPEYLPDLKQYCTKACPSLDLSPMIVVHDPVESDGMYLPESRAQIKCPAGQRYVNANDTTAYCEPSGNWTHATKCAKMCPIVTVQECDVDCPTKQPIIGDIIVITPKKDHVIYSLTTNEYVKEDEIVLTCSEVDGKPLFTPQEEYTCKAVCTMPKIANAMFRPHLSANHKKSEQGRLLLGECLTVLCTPGHIQTPIIGQQLCCVGPETFDSEIPRCEDGCAKFQIANGEVTAERANVSMYDMMDKSVIKCDKGYHLEPVGSEGVVYCNFDRKWTPDPSDHKCVKHCDVSELVVINGAVDHECCNNHVNVGQTVNYKCDAGYYSTSKYVTCDANGVLGDKNMIVCQKAFNINPGVFYMIDETAVVPFSQAEKTCAELNVPIGAKAKVLSFPNIMWFYRFTAYIRTKRTFARANLWTTYEGKGGKFVDEHRVLVELMEKHDPKNDTNAVVNIDKARIQSYGKKAYAACLWHAEVVSPVCWAPEQLIHMSVKIEDHF